MHTDQLYPPRQIGPGSETAVHNLAGGELDRSPAAEGGKAGAVRAGPGGHVNTEVARTQLVGLYGDAVGKGVIGPFGDGADGQKGTRADQ